MRNVLFLLPPRAETSIEELVAVYNFSDCSVQGVLLQESHGVERAFPFPCYILAGEKGEKKTSSAYPYIQYPDMLKMIFEANTVIS